MRSVSVLTFVRQPVGVGNPGHASSPTHTLWICLSQHCPAGVAMFICNTELFGYIMRPHTHPSLKVAAEKFVDFKTKTLGMRKV